MPSITKLETRPRQEGVGKTEHPVYSGVVALEGMARRFDPGNGLWRVWTVDPLKDRSQACVAEAIAWGDRVCALYASGSGLSDREPGNPYLRERDRFGVGNSLRVNPL